jgi:phage-related protein
VLADREFHSQKLAKWLDEQGVCFALRQKKDLHFQENPGQEYQVLEGATKELKRLLDKHYSPHTLPIKWHLIANRCHHFQDQFLALIHRNYPTRTIQTYPKITMSFSSSFIFTHPTNIRLLFLRLSFLTL